MKRLFLIYVFIPYFLHAVSSQDIIKKVEDNLNADNAYMKITMIVTTKRGERKISMESRSIDTSKMFIKILYPKKDKGITFLKIDNTMWQYVPRIEKIIKIPASMMLQSWMGSDFSNDDLVKESSLSKDYSSKLIDENKQNYQLELIPKEDAAVVWGKIIIDISKKYNLPVKVTYYDEDNTLIRVLYYKDIKVLDNRFYPTTWEMFPKTQHKSGHKTLIKIDDALFNKEIDQSYFTKRALKRYLK